MARDTPLSSFLPSLFLPFFSFFPFFLSFPLFSLFSILLKPLHQHEKKTVGMQRFVLVESFGVVTPA